MRIIIIIVNFAKKVFMRIHSNHHCLKTNLLDMTIKIIINRNDNAGKAKEPMIRICMLTSGLWLEGLTNKLIVLFIHLIKMFKFYWKHGQKSYHFICHDATIAAFDSLTSHTVIQKFYTLKYIQKSVSEVEPHCLKMFNKRISCRHASVQLVIDHRCRQNVVKTKMLYISCMQVCH